MAKKPATPKYDFSKPIRLHADEDRLFMLKRINEDQQALDDFHAATLAHLMRHSTEISKRRSDFWDSLRRKFDPPPGHRMEIKGQLPYAGELVVSPIKEPTDA